jgi:hypothetical protein
MHDPLPETIRECLQCSCNTKLNRTQLIRTLLQVRIHEEDQAEDDDDQVLHIITNCSPYPLARR